MSAPSPTSVRAEPRAEGRTETRTDVQVLRGIAVLLVVLQHAGIPGIGAGYLGVDIFFVISGFLMTRLICKDIDRGSLSLTTFYVRRVKRLLPAAYVTFGATAILSAWLLNEAELRDYVDQLLGALTFTSNFVLWKQTGYFATAAAQKPLLHIWSLAVEEQYYLLLPLSLILTPKKLRLWGVAAVCTGSLALCLIAGPRSPSAVFYLLPTRLWELAVGSFGAVISQTRFRPPLPVFWLSVATVVAVPVAPTRLFHPGPDSMLVCLATLLIILRAYEPVQNTTFLPLRLLAGAGDMSYSLYLVHWPLFAYLNNCWVGSEAPPGVRLSVAALALILSAVQYRLIEQRFRRLAWGSPRRVLGIVVTTSMALAAVAVALPYTLRLSGNIGPENRRPNYGFSPQCEYEQDWFRPKSECANSPQPQTALWGDSVAMHLAPGLAHTTDSGVLQATKSSCGPFLGLARIGKAPQSPFNKAWAERCVRFNESVLHYLQATPSIRTVVLSGALPSYFENDQRMLVDGQVRDSSPQALGDGLSRTVRALRAAGKRVVFVAPPPQAGFDAGGCLERLFRGKPILGPFSDCSVSLDLYRRRFPVALQLQSEIARFVPVIDLADTLCQDGRCATYAAGSFLYRDAFHLSEVGSRIVAERMQLGATVSAAAR